MILSYFSCALSGIIIATYAVTCYKDMEFTDLVIKIREILLSSSLQKREAAFSGELPEVTFRQNYYLDVISRMEQPTCSELAEKFRVSRPAVTAIVNKLIDMGYLKKVQCNDDRRVFYIMLSERGERLMESNNAVAREWAQHIESTLSPAELQKYAEFLEKVISSYTLKKT